MANTHLLPEEITIDIFSRLSTKSVCKCRYLSKSWRSRLSTSQFINSHLTRKTHEQNLILITPSHSLHTIAPPIKDDAVSKKLELQNTWTHVVGSCNGLVLLVNEEDELCLVNPITTQKVNVPDSDLALKKDESFRMHGFGYDSFSDDYKIVTLSYYNSYYKTDSEDEDDTFVDVYSVKSGVWKRVDSSPYDHAVPSLASGAFVNGAIHWLASSSESGYRSVIAAFDLNDEVFDEIPAPCTLDSSKFVFNKLVALGGRLCMVDDFSHGTTDVWTTDVWTMEEYGSEESWTKLIGFGENDRWEVVKPLCFVGQEEVVLATEHDEESLILYNVKEGTKKDLVVDGVPAYSIDAGMFVDSLVSLG